MAGVASRTVTILVAVEPPLLAELLQRLLCREGACSGATRVAAVVADPGAPPPAAHFDVVITGPGMPARFRASRSICLRSPTSVHSGALSTTVDPDTLTDLLRQLDEAASSLQGSVTI